MPLFLILLLFSAITLMFYSNRTLETEEFSLVFPELPEAFDGFTIAHLSDLHGLSLDSLTPRLLPALSEIAPDIIVITGDLVDSVQDIPWIFGAVSELTEIAPVYYVSGNHEFATRRFSDIERELNRAGAHVLRNQAARIRRGDSELMLVGIEDLAGPADMLPMEKVIELVRAGKHPFFVTLCHRYDRFDEFVELKLPLVFTGHAHGGLVRLPGTDGIFGPGRTIFPSRTNGLYTEGDTSMIASRGLGNAGLTFRFLSRPHLPVVRLYSK